MGYYEHLCAQLAPLGVYQTGETSLSGAELCAAGAGLDAVAEELEFVEREAVCETAQTVGLTRREELFAHCPVRVSDTLRRAAIGALTRIGENSFTLEAINNELIGCGIAAQVEETEEKGKVRIFFPHTAGVPENFQRIKNILLGMIPCHLLTEFYFRFMTWAECETAGYTWRDVSAHTWKSFQTAVKV